MHLENLSNVQTELNQSLRITEPTTSVQFGWLLRFRPKFGQPIVKKVTHLLSIK